MSWKLSILDQSPIGEDETAVQALHNTVQLARRAEELGYHRFWVAEHHDSAVYAGSSPEVLISYLLACTSRIRIGSGGVMLQHYSPYKVAETFNVLSSLAPGRVDLGIGRAPGGYPLSTKALRAGSAETLSFEQKLTELRHHLDQSLPEDHPLFGVKATPLPALSAELFLLGTSVSSAELAARSGIPYVFAQFLNGDEQVVREALTTYRSHFQPGSVTQPYLMVAVPVIVADTEAEARQLAADHKVVKIHLASGTTINVSSIEAAEAYGRQTKETYSLEVQQLTVIHGTKETVYRQLLALQERYAADELILLVRMRHFRERLRAYEQIQEAFLQQTV